MVAPDISASSSNRTTMAGTAINPSPVAASMIAVSLSKRFMAFREKGKRPFQAACLADISRLIRGFGDRICCGLLLLRRHLRRPELKGQFVDCAGELKRKGVAVVDSRPGVASDVERLVDGHKDGNRVRDLLFGQFLAIDREHTSATLARAGAVIFEIEDERVL